ncbi:hypothetical protein TcG_09464 [Trypanosoma cruzi]|nr:hypothetical protein TcG_09464 [Trypanosoma cruzi]
MKVRFVVDRQVTDCLWHLRCTRLPPLVSPLFDPSRLISLVPLLALITLRCCLFPCAFRFPRHWSCRLWCVAPVGGKSAVSLLSTPVTSSFTVVPPSPRLPIQRETWL